MIRIITALDARDRTCIAKERIAQQEADAKEHREALLDSKMEAVIVEINQAIIAAANDGHLCARMKFKGDTQELHDTMVMKLKELGYKAILTNEGRVLELIWK